MVIDLSCLNQYLEVEHVKMETPASIMVVIRRNDWATSIDLMFFVHRIIAVVIQDACCSLDAMLKSAQNELDAF